MPDPLSATLSALADPTRRAILARLALGKTSVTELAAPYVMSLPAISKHLKVLERAGLIARERQAQSRPCLLVASPLKEVVDWLEGYRRFLGDDLERLDVPFDEPERSGKGKKKKKKKKHGRHK